MTSQKNTPEQNRKEISDKYNAIADLMWNDPPTPTHFSGIEPRYVIDHFDRPRQRRCAALVAIVAVAFAAVVLWLTL